MAEPTKPICYLDVDGTLLMFNNEVCRDHPQGQAPPETADVVRWLAEHYEVRWLTAWCPSGDISGRARELGALLGLEPELLLSFRNPRAWWDAKHEGIDPDRPFIWIDDELLDRDRQWLDARGLYHSFVRCESSRYPAVLGRIWRKLQRHDAQGDA